MFLRFQTLVAGQRVLNKGYSMSYHVKKIIRSFPSKWRPMVTALKLAKDLNNTSLKELVSSLRSHDIKLEQDEPQKRGNLLGSILSKDLRSPKLFKIKRLRIQKKIMIKTKMSYQCCPEGLTNSGRGSKETS